RERARVCKDTPGVHEGRDLEIDARRDGIEGEHTVPQLHGRAEGMTIDEAIVPEPPQRLFATEDTAIAADAAQRPEWHVVGAEKISQRHVAGEDSVVEDRPERAAVNPRLGIKSIMEKAVAARGEAAVGDQLQAPPRDRGVVTRVVGQREAMQEFPAGAEPGGRPEA